MKAPRKTVLKELELDGFIHILRCPVAAYTDEAAILLAKDSHDPKFRVRAVLVYPSWGKKYDRDQIAEIEGFISREGLDTSQYSSNPHINHGC